MANHYYYYHNPGAILRRLFPKQLNTQALILIWTVIFILNIAIVILMQNFVIYRITDLSAGGLQELAYFEDCDVIGVSTFPQKITSQNSYYVKYIDENKETRVVCLDVFPRKIFSRWRLLKSTDMQLMEDNIVAYVNKGETTNVSLQEYVELANPAGIVDIFLMNKAMQNLAGIYVAIGAGMLLIEFLIYSVFHRLFRE
ncbi:MAG: hypothetical protein IJ958_07400 [Agathobacter sp.]|nr:hypothetical protein [Agathobacter sp.]